MVYQRLHRLEPESMNGLRHKIPSPFGILRRVLRQLVSECTNLAPFKDDKRKIAVSLFPIQHTHKAGYTLNILIGFKASLNGFLTPSRISHISPAVAAPVVRPNLQWPTLTVRFSSPTSPT